MLAASALMAGAAPPPAKSSPPDQGLQSYPNASIALDLKPAPQLVLGNETRITGVIVDFAKPEQTWSMWNPALALPARNLQKLSAPAVPPVLAPHDFNDALAVHEPNFALLRLSFR
jgi:hypothetical protein